MLAIRTVLTALLFLSGASAAQAQSASEFNRNFYNGHRCMQVGEINSNGVRQIAAKNRCQVRVAALVCYRIITTSGVYDAVGWYCDYSNLYNPGTTRIVSRAGRYHPDLKHTACAATNTRCDQVLRSTNIQVGDSHNDPEVIARTVRTGGGS